LVGRFYKRRRVMSGYCDKCGCTLCVCGESEGLRDTSEFCLKTLDEVKKDLLISTLVHFNGNRTKSAISMDVSIRTLRNMIAAIREGEPELYTKIPPSWNISMGKSGHWRGYARD